MADSTDNAKNKRKHRGSKKLSKKQKQRNKRTDFGASDNRGKRKSSSADKRGGNLNKEEARSHEAHRDSSSNSSSSSSSGSSSSSSRSSRTTNNTNTNTNTNTNNVDANTNNGRATGVVGSAPAPATTATVETWKKTIDWDAKVDRMEENANTEAEADCANNVETAVTPQTKLQNSHSPTATNNLLHGIRKASGVVEYAKKNLNFTGAKHFEEYAEQGRKKVRGLCLQGLHILPIVDYSLTHPRMGGCFW